MRSSHFTLPQVEGIEELIREEVEQVCASPEMIRADHLTRMLRFCATQTLSGKGDDLKEYTIATQVFHRDENFDPRLSSIVRTQAAKLRIRLDRHYKKTNRRPKVRIRLEPGSYVTRFSLNEPSLIRQAGVGHAHHADQAAMLPSVAYGQGQPRRARQTALSPELVATLRPVRLLLERHSLAQTEAALRLITGYQGGSGSTSATEIGKALSLISLIMLRREPKQDRASESKLLVAEVIARGEESPYSELADAAVTALADWNFPTAGIQFSALSSVAEVDFLALAYEILLVHLPTGNFQESMYRLRELQQRRPGSPLSEFTTGMCHQFGDDQAKAQNAFRNVLNWEPTCWPAAQFLCQSYLRSGRAQEATDVVNRYDTSGVSKNSILALHHAIQSHNSSTVSAELPAGVEVNLPLFDRVSRLCNLGQDDAAARLIDEATRQRSFEALYLNIDARRGELERFPALRIPLRLLSMKMLLNSPQPQ